MTGLAHLGPATAVLAQAPGPADVYYGRGVQAFHNEEWRRAEAYFDRAVSFAPGEPRGYYFRGVARGRLDKPYEAENDIRQGAMLEAGKPSSYSIGAALNNLPSEDRKLLDKIRTEMLSDLPSRSDGAGLPGGSQRAAMALRPKFRLRLESLESLASPQDLARLAEAARPLPGESPLAGPDPFVDDPLAPETMTDSTTKPDAEGQPAPAQLSPEAQQTAEMVRALGRTVGQMIATGGQGAPGAGDGMPPFGAPGGMPGAGDDPFAAPPAAEMDPFGSAPGGPQSPAMENGAADPFGGSDTFGGSDPFGGGGEPSEPGAPADADEGASDAPASDTPAEESDPFGGEVDPLEGDPFGGGADPFG